MYINYELTFLSTTGLIEVLRDDRNHNRTAYVLREAGFQASHGTGVLRTSILGLWHYKGNRCFASFTVEEPVHVDKKHEERPPLQISAPITT
jgi:hypothetical protein